MIRFILSMNILCSEMNSTSITYTDEILRNIPDSQKSMFDPIILKSIADMFSLVNENLGDIDECTFFEFGSKHYTFPRKEPFSPEVSHYFTQYSNLKYFCFDPESDRELYVKGIEILKDIFYKGKWQYSKILSARNMANLGLDMIRDYTEDYFSSRDVAINYIENLPTLLPKIDLGALNYDTIVEKIKIAQKPVIFSNNVMNYPINVLFEHKGLQLAYPFWNIKRGTHIHKVNHEEILKKIGYLGREAKYLSRNGFTLNQTNEFKEYFKISNDVFAKKGLFGDITFYWQNQ
jgi:hypothetical protein